MRKKLVTCQLDTAAARNIVCLKDYYRWGQPKLEPSSVTLVTYDGTKMKSKGKTTVKFKRVEKPITFEVIDTTVEQRHFIGIDLFMFRCGTVEDSRTSQCYRE